MVAEFRDIVQPLCDGLTPDEALRQRLRQRPAEHWLYGPPAVPPVFWLLPSWVRAAPRDRAPLHAVSAPSSSPYSAPASSPAAGLPAMPHRTAPVLSSCYPFSGPFNPACRPLFLPLL